MHLFMGALSYSIQRSLLQQWHDIFHGAYIAEAVDPLSKPYEVRVRSHRSSTVSNTPTVPVST